MPLQGVHVSNLALNLETGCTSVPKCPGVAEQLIQDIAIFQLLTDNHYLAVMVRSCASLGLHLGSYHSGLAVIALVVAQLYSPFTSRVAVTSELLKVSSGWSCGGGLMVSWAKAFNLSSLSRAWNLLRKRGFSRK